MMTNRLVRSPNVLWRRTLRGVVLRPVDGNAIMLDGSGWLVWDALASPATLEELSKQLAGRTASDAKIIEADVRPVLDKLARLGAVVPAS
jgi:Coenzyme PQQ synthesis protein D (PqqD)